MSWFTITVDHPDHGFEIVTTLEADSAETASVLAHAMFTHLDDSYTLDVFEALPEEIPARSDAHAIW